MEWNDIIDLKTASKEFGREESTLRRAIAKGYLVDGVDCKKYGNQWVVLRSSMQRLYVTNPVGRKKHADEEEKTCE